MKRVVRSLRIELKAARLTLSRKAREASVAGEDVSHLVVEQGEFRAIHAFAVRGGEVAEVAVIQRSASALTIFLRRACGAGDERMATVGADDDPCAHGPLARRCRETGAADTVCVPQKRVRSRSLKQIHRARAAGSIGEQMIERLAPHGHAVADAARILGRSDRRLGGSPGVVVLAIEPRRPERQDPLQETESMQDRHEAGAAEEVRGDRGLGNAARSTIDTRWPASPSSAAKLHPATRAPTIITS